MALENRHEVMVVNYGSHWGLRLRRTDAGPIDLPEQYATEDEAVSAAREFLRARRESHPAENWFCLAS